MQLTDAQTRELLYKYPLIEKENVGYDLALKLLNLKVEIKKLVTIQDEYLTNRLNLIGSQPNIPIDTNTKLGIEALKINNEINLNRDKHINEIEFILTGEEKDKLLEVCKAKGTIEYLETYKLLTSV